MVEVLVSGDAVVVSNPHVREQAESIAGSPVVVQRYVLFEFRVNRVLVVEYDEQGKPVVRRWSTENAPDLTNESK